MNLLTDFHHNSLLRSTVLLFEKRLGINVYRPIGLDWFHNGFWAINNSIDTAKQFLDINSAVPSDGTPSLNSVNHHEDGKYYVFDPGYMSTHKGITFDTFKDEKFDFVIASIPEHIDLFKRLIQEYQPQAKLIVQIGNNWDSFIFDNLNVLASVKPGSIKNANAVYYHQEFDLDIFKPTDKFNVVNINSYINILQNMPVGWQDFLNLESRLSGSNFIFKSYGGQCRDGNKAGPVELSDAINDSFLTFHVKDGGDGYGHILYNSFACGKPIITRRSFYNQKLGEELLTDETCIDLDSIGIEDACDLIMNLSVDKSLLSDFNSKVYERFCNVVDFESEAAVIKKWIENL